MRAGLLLLASFLAAGCLVPSAPGPAAPQAPPDEADRDAPRPLRLTLGDCRFHEGGFQVPLEYVAQGLPAGFRARPTAEALGIGSPTGFLFWTAFTCGATEVDGAASAETELLWGVVAVEPPESYRADDIGFHGVILGSIHATPTAKTVFAAWELGEVAEGEVSLDSTGQPPSPQQGTAVAMAGGGVTLTTAVAGPDDVIEEFHARFYAVRDGELRGVVDLVVTRHAQATGSAAYEARAGAPFQPPPERSAGIGYIGSAEAFTFTRSPP